MEPKIKFNSAMFGFSKQDVLAYIEMLINKGEEERVTLEEQVSALNMQLDDKTRLYEALLEREMELEALLSPSEEEGASGIGDIKEQLSAQTRRADGLKLEVDNLNGALSEIKAQNEKLAAQLKEATDELSEYRRQKQNIGSVLMRAQNEADIMVSDAESMRDAIILKTENYINDIRKMYEKYSLQISLEQNSVKLSTQNIMSEFENIRSYVLGAQNMLNDMASFLVKPNTKAEG